MEARILASMGNLADDRNEKQEALIFYEQALQLARRIGDERLGADIRWNRSRIVKSDNVTSQQPSRHDCMHQDRIINGGLR